MRANTLCIDVLQILLSQTYDEGVLLIGIRAFYKMLYFVLHFGCSIRLRNFFLRLSQKAEIVWFWKKSFFRLFPIVIVHEKANSKISSKQFFVTLFFWWKIKRKKFLFLLFLTLETKISENNFSSVKFNITKIGEIYFFW